MVLNQIGSFQDLFILPSGIWCQFSEGFGPNCGWNLDHHSLHLSVQLCLTKTVCVVRAFSLYFFFPLEYSVCPSNLIIPLPYSSSVSVMCVKSLEQTVQAISLSATMFLSVTVFLIPHENYLRITSTSSVFRVLRQSLLLLHVAPIYRLNVCVIPCSALRNYQRAMSHK